MSMVALAPPLSFVERVSELLRRVEIRRAESDEDREAIFHLRYNAYLREGTIEPNFGRRVSDQFDDLDNAWLIGIHLDGRLVSSIRVHIATGDFPDLPAAHVFPEFVIPLVEAGNTVVDPTRFVIDAMAARLYPELPYVTVRVAHVAAEYFQADYVLATVRSEHQAFYRRVFGHTLVCPARPYPGLTKPISLMMMNCDAEREQINRRYPFFVSSQAERAALFGEPDEVSRRIAAAAARHEVSALAG